MPDSTTFRNIDLTSLKIITSSGREFNLINMFINFNIYESIFSHYMHGELVFNDTFDILSNLPLYGNEDLEIIFSSPETSDAINSTMKIYKIEKEKSVNKTIVFRKTYRIYFCSPEMITNQYKICRKFIGTGDSIISDIITTYLESPDVTQILSEGSNDLSFIANYWTPSECIKYICDKTESLSNHYYDFIFFENIYGFNFISISELLTHESTETLIFKNDIINTFLNTNIKYFKFEEYFDILHSIKKGVLGSRSIVPEYYTYKINEYTNDFSTQTQNLTFLGQSSHFNSNLYKEYGFYYDLDENEFMTLQQMSINMLFDYALVVQLNGEITRSAGDIITIDFPSLDNFSEVNQNYNGKYLIMNIRHEVDSEGSYTQNLLLGKNAFWNNSRIESVGGTTNL